MVFYRTSVINGEHTSFESPGEKNSLLVLRRGVPRKASFHALFVCAVLVADFSMNYRLATVAYLCFRVLDEIRKNYLVRKFSALWKILRVKLSVRLG